MWGRWIFGRRPYEDSLSIHTRSLPLSPQGGSLSTRSRQSRSPGSTFPHGLPREAGGHQKRLLGSTGIFLLLGPLASTWAVSVSLTGTCLGGPVHPPKGSLILW